MRSTFRTVARAAALGSLLLLPARVVHAQAWVATGGEGTVSLLYHHIFVEDHFFSKGERRDLGHIRSHTVMLDVDYGVTDKISIRVAVPYIAAKYAGASPHRHPGELPGIDGLGYNAGIQDIRGELRYAAIEFPFAVTPFVSLNLPSHDYEIFGHSAIGINLRELQVGAYGGAVRAPYYLQARYGYGIYERVHGNRRTRSTLDLEIGWLATPRFRVFAFETGQLSHSGLQLAADHPLSELPFEQRHHHDQLVRASSLAFGAGAAVRVSGPASLHGSVLTMVDGRNTHATKYGLVIGATWSFGGPSRRHHTAIPDR